MAQTKEERKAAKQAASRSWAIAHPDKVKEYSLRYQERNKDKIRQRNKDRMKKWRDENPEESRRRVREYQQLNPDKVKSLARKRWKSGSMVRYREENKDKLIQYGRDRYKIKRDELLGYQNSRRILNQEAAAGRPRPTICEVCERPGRISFDHCHATGVFRGWLCGRCNSALGLVWDNPEILRSLATYLESQDGQKLGRRGDQEQGRPAPVAGGPAGAENPSQQGGGGDPLQQSQGPQAGQLGQNSQGNEVT